MLISSQETYYHDHRLQKVPLKLWIYRRYLKFLRMLSSERYSRKLAKLFVTPRQDRSAILERYRSQNYFDLGQEMYLTLAGHNIFVYLEGTPKVLLVHGWESSAHRLATIMQALRDEKIGFMYLDLPAHGRSSGEYCHVPLSAEVIRALLHQYPEIETIVGHSFGGGASYLALSDTTEVTRLITLGTPLKYEAVSEPFFLLLDVEENNRDLFFKGLKSMFGVNLRDYDLSKIPLPDGVKWTIIHSKDDPQIPWFHAPLVQEAFPNVELKLVEGLGHKKIAHDPEIVSLILSQIQPVHS